MKKLIAVLMVGAVVVSPAMVRAQDAAAPAGDAGAGKPAHEHGKGMPELKAMTVTGKIAKEDMPGRDGKASPHFVLTDASGAKIVLHSGTHGKAGEAAAPVPAVNLDEYVGKNVTVTGKGFEREHDGKKMTMMVKIEKVEAAATDAK